MLLISWNVNGLRACVKNGFEAFLAQYRPDIIGLQEIKMDLAARDKQEFDFVDYQETWFPAERKGYSGTGVLSTTAYTVRNGFGFPEFDKEGRVQTVDIGPAYLINAYFPNAQPGLVRLAYKEEFNKNILAYAKQLAADKPVIITGDFNVARESIDLARPQQNIGEPGFSDEERYWGREFLRQGFKDTFRELHGQAIKYSWWSYRAGARERNVGWRIDYFLVSTDLLPKIRRADILDHVRGSDHAPVLLEVDF